MTIKNKVFTQFESLRDVHTDLQMRSYCSEKFIRGFAIGYPEVKPQTIDRYLRLAKNKLRRKYTGWNLPS